MAIVTQRRPLGNGHINIFNRQGVSWGFTEWGTRLDRVVEHLSGQSVIQLKQIHSADIWTQSDRSRKTEGDGIILTETQVVAVIKTADCVPLFVWDSSQSIAGVIHIGWRGLARGIDIRMMKELGRLGSDFSHLKFFLGPSISGTCYTVGEDVRTRFQEHPHRDLMFSSPDRGKFMLDLKAGIHAGLTAAGIRSDQIFASGICNHCETDRFPSHRRDGQSNARIFNFMVLK